MLFNPKALFYVSNINNNLNGGDSVPGTGLSLGVFSSASFLSDPPSVFYEAAGTWGCFLLASSLVLQGHSAVLLQSRTCDWTWQLPGAPQHRRVAAQRGNGGKSGWKAFWGLMMLTSSWTCSCLSTPSAFCHHETVLSFFSPMILINFHPETFENGFF